MVHPFTMTVAVGGYDVPHQKRWRCPEDDEVQYPACKVRLFDITRGLPQRIEGQFRRHWGFTPALWNLYFRSELNLSISLSVKQQTVKATPGEPQAEDAAMVAAALLDKLNHGHYVHN